MIQLLKTVIIHHYSSNNRELVESELLLFAKEEFSCDSLAKDQLVKMCVDYYREDEIIAARDLMNQFTKK